MIMMVVRQEWGERTGDKEKCNLKMTLEKCSQVHLFLFSDPVSRNPADGNNSKDRTKMFTATLSEHKKTVNSVNTVKCGLRASYWPTFAKCFT